MDRCALFVDAGYLLADGAMAVHGTRHREACSWNHAGLLRLVGDLARERTGLPLLRCYWYEATVEGRRTPEHDALADLPGLKLRLGRSRPGRREGVDAYVHRDLLGLARSHAICDAVLVSGDEDMTPIVTEAQDLGVRITVVHVAVDGNWTVARSLRQECDELIEIGSGHLRPHVQLITGVETASTPSGGASPLSNGRALDTGGHTALHPAHSGEMKQVSQLYAEPPPAESPAQVSQGQHGQGQHLQSQHLQSQHGQGQHGQAHAGQGHSTGAHQALAAVPQPQDAGPVPGGTPPGGTPAAAPPSGTPPHGLQSAPTTGSMPQAAPVPQPLSAPPPAAPAAPAHSANGSGGYPADYAGHAGATGGFPAQPGPPSYSTGPYAAPVPQTHQQAYQQPPAAPPTQQPSAYPQPAAYGETGHDPAGQSSADPGAAYGRQPQQAQQPSLPAPYGGQPATSPSLADAVKAAHQEGRDFGDSVARDAPALWLEAVLARKPRMPSDLEARLLQGSSLPIDYLLHDEVRHALRRGFWDALETSRPV